MRGRDRNLLSKAPSWHRIICSTLGDTDRCYLKKSVANSVSKVLKNYEKIKLNGSGNEKKINAQKIKEKIAKGLDQGKGLSLSLKP